MNPRTFYNWGYYTEMSSFENRRSIEKEPELEAISKEEAQTILEFN